MPTTPIAAEKTIGAYDAKTHFAELLDLVEHGRSITITRRSRNVARLVPADAPTIDRSVFSRIRALHSRLTLPKGESLRDLIDAGRRI
jgi:prevent-host-death family protein